ncbi:hypothetical protein OB69_12640 [Roseivirga seohaensis subsp. aquiponti]|uniref:DUF4393 domain-containing protein n=1 Tax=Roseivirga seohaensis subsp. aquiponti TaxID=1566026 RepID=A0A0L8AIL4_9BACT|nr:hypothetical protein [Roseivirga seohaensis]KOF02273.1 hypothetical protein OB69_12640 [Roseivirga seohaensis subsp. aquiponti]
MISELSKELLSEVADQVNFPAIIEVISMTALNIGVEEFLKKNLSKREKTKLSHTVILAWDKYRKNIELGLAPSCKFDSLTKFGRTEMEEFQEGVMRKSLEEHRENKLLVYANLLGNVAFKDCEPGIANTLLSIAEKLTYEQIKLLAFIGRISSIADFNPISFESNSRNKPDSLTPKTKWIMMDYTVLRDLNLVGLGGDKNEGGSVSMSSLSSYLDVNLENLYLSFIGQRFFDVSDLIEIEIEELKEIQFFLSKESIQ